MIHFHHPCHYNTNRQKEKSFCRNFVSAISPLRMQREGEGSRLCAHVLCLPQRGRGTALAVDEEKVDGKLAIIKIRNDHNTSSVRRDIIYPTPKPSSHVCHLPQGEGSHLSVAASPPKGKAFVCGRRFATQGEGFFVIPII